jgi:IclR family acetate operon transcriptional repressor
MIAQPHSQYVMNSAYRTLQVLLSFSAPPHRFSLAEITARMGLDKNQVYRSLKTLEEAGFLRVESDGRFGLTALLSVLGTAAAGSQQVSLVDVAAPHLDRLAAETQESLNLFVLAGESAVCVDRRDSPRPVRLNSVLGLSVPLHAGACPQAILAYLPRAEQEHILERLASFPRYTDKTITDPKALRLEISRIRERGYSISDEDVDASARGVGAPLFDHSGSVIGAISLGAPSFRVDDATLSRFGELIVHAARAVSRQLGYAG